MSEDINLEALDNLNIPDGATESEVLALASSPAAEGAKADGPTKIEVVDSSEDIDLSAVLKDLTPEPAAAQEQAAPVQTPEPTPAQPPAFTPEVMSAAIAQAVAPFAQALAQSQQQLAALLERQMTPQPAAPAPDPEPDPTDVIEHQAWMRREIARTQQVANAAFQAQQRVIEEMKQAQAKQAYEAQIASDAEKIGRFLEASVPQMFQGTSLEKSVDAEEILLERMATHPVLRTRNADQIRAAMKAEVQTMLRLAPRPAAPPAPPASGSPSAPSVPGQTKQVDMKKLNEMIEAGDFESFDKHMKALAKYADTTS